MIKLFGRDKRKKDRVSPEAAVIFTVRSGKDPERVSSTVNGVVKDISSKGMSVITPWIAPDGIHIMYDNLMVHKNSIDATIVQDGKPTIQVAGSVVWFRDSEDCKGKFIFGMRFDKEVDLKLMAFPHGGIFYDR
jgi:hypothetical protein